MQTLRGGALVPSGMLAGGVTEGHQREMSAPGSPSVVNMPVSDVLPQPMAAGQFPLGHPGQQPHVSSAGGSGGGSWSQAGGSGSGWKEVP